MYANLTNPATKIVTGNDGIVVRNILQTKRGGTTLDVTGFAPDLILEGHILIMETATKVYKPLPVNAGATAYQALPSGHEYKGVVIATVPKVRPFVGVLEIGDINVKAAPYGLAASANLAAIKTANSLITFTED